MAVWCTINHHWFIMIQFLWTWLPHSVYILGMVAPMVASVREEVDVSLRPYIYSLGLSQTAPQLWSLQI